MVPTIYRYSVIQHSVIECHTNSMIHDPKKTEQLKGMVNTKAPVLGKSFFLRFPPRHLNHPSLPWPREALPLNRGSCLIPQ